MSVMAKAIAAFLTSLVALIAALGFDTGTWVTPNLIESGSAVLGAVATAVVTYLVPNKPAASTWTGLS